VQQDENMIELKRKAIKYFKIEDLKEENVRIRAYMSHNETMQDAY